MGALRMLCSAWNTIMKLKVPEIPKGIPSEKACRLEISFGHGLYHQIDFFVDLLGAMYGDFGASRTSL